MTTKAETTKMEVKPTKPYMPVTLRKDYKWIYVGGKWTMYRKMNLTGNTI